MVLNLKTPKWEAESAVSTFTSVINKLAFNDASLCRLILIALVSPVEIAQIENIVNVTRELSSMRKIQRFCEFYCDKCFYLERERERVYF